MTYQPEHDATPPFHQQIQGRERCKDRMNESYAFLPVAHQGSHIVINTRVIESITPPSSADPPDRYGVTYRIGDRLRLGFATTVDLIKAGVQRPRRRGDGHRCRIMEGKSVKFNKYYICVTDLRDEQILVHTRDIVLVLPPTLFGGFGGSG